MAITSDSNMEQMQQDALRRARELYARARPIEACPAENTRQEPPAVKAQVPAQVPAGAPAQASVRTPTPNGSGLEVLLQDKDKTVILALLLLLGDSGGQELLFALLFLLL